MAEQNAEHEPTMEEILASIRRIINEDDEGGEAKAEPAEAPADAEAAAEPAPEAPAEPEFAPEPEAEPEMEAAAPEPAPEPEPEDDVFELTDRVDGEAAGTDPMAMSDDLMIVDREEEPVAEPEPEPEPVAAAPEPEPEPEPAPQPAPMEDGALLGSAAAGVAASAFSALSSRLRVSEQPGQTLEGIVREMLRPMLKEWLDANLPRIVEEKVEAEIERVSRRQG